MKVIWVRWIDSVGTDAWESLEDFDAAQSQQCESVGWLLEETEDVIALTHSIGIDGHGDPESSCGYIIIPKVAIQQQAVVGEYANSRGPDGTLETPPE